MRLAMLNVGKWCSFKPWLALGACLAVGGCSTGSSLTVEEFTDYINDRKAPRLAVQVCIPNKTSFFDELVVDVADMPADIPFPTLRKMFIDAEKYKRYSNPYSLPGKPREYETIRQWRAPLNDTDYPRHFIKYGDVKNVKGIRSEGVGTAYLTGATDKDQSVFFIFTDERPGDVLALNVRLEVLNQQGNPEWRKFWFKPPKDIQKNTYGKWMAPISEEGTIEQSAQFSTGLLLMNGRKIPIYNVQKNAPKMRHMLISREEYVTLRDDGMRAKNAARLKFTLDHSTSERERYHLISNYSELIPSCE